MIFSAGQRRATFRIYANAFYRKGVLVRPIACRVTANFRAGATLVLRGPARSAIAQAMGIVLHNHLIVGTPHELNFCSEGYL